MSLSPWLPWPSAPPGPSSFSHWLLHHFVVIAILFTVADSSSVSSNQTDTLCANPSEFPHLMHTIGSIDGTLWAISTDKWNVYELEPCKNNDSTHCMQVNPHNARLPVLVDTKWPKLGEAVKNATQKTDFSLSVNNSFFMDSSIIKHTVLVMFSSAFLKGKKFFEFDFGTNQSFPINWADGEYPSEEVWISSDVKDKAYRLLESGKVFNLVTLTKDSEGDNIKDGGGQGFICNSTKQDGLEVMFSNNCTLNVSWTVVKGVQFRHQFYLFAPDKVYIFSDKALNVSTKVLTVSYEDFLQCKNPTTLSPPRHSTTNSTNSTTSTTHGHKVTTAKESNNTILIVVIAVVVIVVLLLVAVAVWYFYFHKKAAKNGQNMAGPKLGAAPSPASALHSDISSIPQLNIDELKKASYEKSDSRLGYAMENKLFTQKGPNSKAQSKVEGGKRKRPASDSGSFVATWSKDGSNPSEVPASKMGPITKKKESAGKTAQQSSQSKQTVHSKQSKSAVVKGKGSMKNPLPNKNAKGGLTMESEYSKSNN